MKKVRCDLTGVESEWYAHQAGVTMLPPGGKWKSVEVRVSGCGTQYVILCPEAAKRILGKFNIKGADRQKAAGELIQELIGDIAYDVASGYASNNS